MGDWDSIIILCGLIVFMAILCIVGIVYNSKIDNSFVQTETIGR